jgi:hypothetical protein
MIKPENAKTGTYTSEDAVQGVVKVSGFGKYGQILPFMR